jgi:hypothetical protein
MAEASEERAAARSELDMSRRVSLSGGRWGALVTVNGRTQFLCSVPADRRLLRAAGLGGWPVVLLI